MRTQVRSTSWSVGTRACVNDSNALASSTDHYRMPHITCLRRFHHGPCQGASCAHSCQIGVIGHRCCAPSHSDACVLWLHPAHQTKPDSLETLNLSHNTNLSGCDEVSCAIRDREITRSNLTPSSAPIFPLSDTT